MCGGARGAARTPDAPGANAGATVYGTVTYCCHYWPAIRRTYVRAMWLKETPMAVRVDMIGIVVRDMRNALRFYRLLELGIPTGVEGEPHVEVTTPNGYRIAWDALEMIK